MSWVVIAGVLVGGGLWLAWSGWVPAREPLAAVLARLGQQPAQPVTGVEESRDARLGAIVRRIPLIDRRIASMATDLRILRRSADEQAAQLVAYAALGFLWVPVFAVGALVVAGIVVPVVVIGWGALIGAAAGAVVPLRRVKTQAEARRREFAGALGALCDVTGMSLAAGRGIDAALQTAASTGQGWAFGEFRSALAAGYRRGITPWDALAQLGHDTGSEDLVELGAALALAGEDGASVRATIRAKARSIREHLTSAIEGDAASTTERMSIPATMLLLGFLLFLGYPAMSLILNQSNP